MAGYVEENGSYVKGIEDYLTTAQYEREEHQNEVVRDILDNWLRLSHNNKFHALFATSSIAEAIEYYRLFKIANPNLKVTALFDPNIDNMGNVAFKEAGLVEIIQDYNSRYDQDFSMPTHGKFKKDIAARLAHKEPHKRIHLTPDKQIDLLIVVDQMLTGYDSKYINTLYLDKLLRYESIIQAFSRTNRLFSSEKPFGTIRYYRKPHTMERNINTAIKLYSGDKPLGLFVEHLDYNLNRMNDIYYVIAELFSRAGVANFERLPANPSECGRFAKLFKEFNNHLEAAKIQGFYWDKQRYEFRDENGNLSIVELTFDETTYLILALRYKELFAGSGGGGGGYDDVPYEIDGHLTEIDTGVINADYMNSRFEKFYKLIELGDIDKEQMQITLDELHKSFASLTQEEQKYANIFLHDVQNGDAKVDANKTFRDYITEYQYNAKNDQIKRVSFLLGLNETKLRNMMNAGLNEININEFARFDELKNTVDRQKAKVFFEQLEGATIQNFRVNIKVHNLLLRFIVSGGFEI
jgi:type I restriction enzyme R subunit